MEQERSDCPVLLWCRGSQISSMKRRLVSRGKKHTSTVTPERPTKIVNSWLFDMRLLVLVSTALSGPQLIKANKPRSIIYAVIVHEVKSALERTAPLGTAERVSRRPHFRDCFVRRGGSGASSQGRRPNQIPVMEY